MLILLYVIPCYIPSKGMVGYSFSSDAPEEFINDFDAKFNGYFFNQRTTENEMDAFEENWIREHEMS